MNSQKCSQCGLVNFANAEFCKRCQAQITDFGQPAFQNNYSGNFSPQNASCPTTGRVVSESLWENAGFRKIIYGILWVIGGCILTYYTTAIFYGAIIFGVIDILRGVTGLFTDTDG
jgi:hypothetical protein